MRVFIPALTDELVMETPVLRRGWVALIPRGTHPEQAEVYEDDAVTEAALDGLTVLRDEKENSTRHLLHRRLVLAFDVKDSDLTVHTEQAADEEGVVVPVDVHTLTWMNLVAMMVDDADAESAVQSVIEATDQDSADDAISDLWDHAIGWFDSAEREELAAAFAQ